MTIKKSIGIIFLLTLIPTICLAEGQYGMEGFFIGVYILSFLLFTFVGGLMIIGILKRFEDKLDIKMGLWTVIASFVAAFILSSTIFFLIK